MFEDKEVRMDERTRDCLLVISLIGILSVKNMPVELRVLRRPRNMVDMGLGREALFMEEYDLM